MTITLATPIDPANINALEILIFGAAIAILFIIGLVLFILRSPKSPPTLQENQRSDRTLKQQADHTLKQAPLWTLITSGIFLLTLLRGISSIPLLLCSTFAGLTWVLSMIRTWYTERKIFSICGLFLMYSANSMLSDYYLESASIGQPNHAGLRLILTTRSYSLSLAFAMAFLWVFRSKIKRLLLERPIP